MRHLVGLRGVERTHLEELIERARSLRGRGMTHALAGRAVGLLFFEPSTRTRFSFEMACHRLGAHPLAFSADASSTTKGESVEDTVRVLRAIGAEVVVVRHQEVGLPQRLAEVARVAVVNAGDGTNEHPTQGLLDLVTIRDHFPDFRGLSVGIVGDILHSRVARSAAHGLRTLGADVLLAGPPTLQDPSLRALGCLQRTTLAEVAPDVDVLMMLRIQRERLGTTTVPSTVDYRTRWGLTEAAADRLRDHTIVMHPGPMNRGVEIDDVVADGPRSVIFDQMANGVYARMAVLLDVLEPLESPT